MSATSQGRLPKSIPLPSVPFALLAVLLAALWLAGGASRPDVLGQVVVRCVAWLAVIILLLMGPRLPRVRTDPVALLLLFTIALPAIQLVPLPPELWQRLPGRDVFIQAATLSGQAQPWRPLSIVPGATLNALASLIVPVATWLLASSLNDAERRRLPGMLLCVVIATMLVGLAQFSGIIYDNPFVNDSPGEISGTFANRNHFSLLMAIGCLLAPTWGLAGERLAYWRLPAVVGLLLLLFLTILGSGSRAGLGLGVVALLLGVILSGHRIRKALAFYPRWVYPTLVAAFAVIIIAFVSLSVMADRAVSINRAFALDAGQDMRTRGLPTVLSMIKTYFPFGSGLGGFDPIFRIHEPFALLAPTYFNHAHNDYLEIVLDTGLLGAVLVLSALVWWGRASMTVWTIGMGRAYALPRLGSATIFLVMIASLFDYPARVPLIMAVTVIAGIWLNATAEVTTLPRRGQHL